MHQQQSLALQLSQQQASLEQQVPQLPSQVLQALPSQLLFL
jgi:hypothetical protein